MTLMLDMKQVYESYQKEIYSYFYFRVRDEHIAADLLQETFVRVVEHGDQVRNEEKLGNWIRTIARNVYNQYYKKYKKELTHRMEQWADEEDASIVETVAGDEMDILAQLICEENVRRLSEVVAKLSTREQLLLILRFDEEKSLEEMAEILNTNLNTVKSKLYRCLKKCQKMYKELEGGTDK